MCDADKTPGPDGFSMGVFLRFFHPNFPSQEFSDKSFNATYVILTPKKNGVKELKDFRSMSLIGSVYKIISKLLTVRLRKVVGKLVSK